MRTLPRYRVWCLSWEDTEEDGTDVVVYDILSHDYRTQDRRSIYVPYGDPSDAAEAYADFAHSNRDGYECTWPLMFRVRCQDGTLVDFEVDREIVPEFSARPIKPLEMPPSTHVLWDGRALCEDLRLRGVPRDWSPDQRWISLRDVADGAETPSDRCEGCWKKMPGLVTGLRQIGTFR